MKTAGRKPHPLAVSTGQAARWCFVTSDTIVNWIKAGLLTAQRTAGGQYRILVDELKAFMKSRGMSTSLLETDSGPRPQCWQFHAPSGPQQEEDCLDCSECVVKHLGVLNCFKLMGMHPGPGHRHLDCEDCEYFRQWSQNDPTHTHAEKEF